MAWDFSGVKNLATSEKNWIMRNRNQGFIKGMEGLYKILDKGGAKVIKTNTVISIPYFCLY